MESKYPLLTYVRHAFYNWYNYGGMILFGGLGLIMQEPAYFLFGAGLELTYLYYMSMNPRFRRAVDAELEEKKQLQVDVLRDALWPLIHSDLRERFGELENLVAKLRAEKPVPGVDASMLKDNQRKVAVLLGNYLKLSVAVSRYRNYLAGVNEATIKGDIARLGKELESASERVAEIKKKNVEILEKRLEKVTKAKSNCEYLVAQLQTIEDTLRLVVDQAVTLSDPKGTAVQIDTLLDTLKETDLVAAEMDAFEELEAGLTDEVIPTKQ